MSHSFPCGLFGSNLLQARSLATSSDFPFSLRLFMLLFSSVSYYISRFQSFSVPAADADVHAADAAVAVDAVAVAAR